MRSTDDAVPREELIKNISGCTALICMLTDKIDKEVLDAAGKYIFTLKATTVFLQDILGETAPVY